jgi:hypothetical protein
MQNMDAKAEYSEMVRGRRRRRRRRFVAPRPGRPVAPGKKQNHLLQITARSAGQQLAQYCRTQNIIPTSQHGFQTGKSTITALGAVTQYLKAMKQAGLEVGCLLFDLSAAFDLLDADVFARKIEIYGAINRDYSCMGQKLSNWKVPNGRVWRPLLSNQGCHGRQPSGICSLTPTIYHPDK